MADETDLLNDALIQAGAATISGISEGTVNANHCKRLYPALRDAEIASHKWNFSLKRVSIAADVATPAFEYTYQHSLPADYLRVWEFNGLDSTDVYVVENHKILSSAAPPALVVYGAQITNAGLFAPLFYQALTQLLGSKLSLAIPHDEKRAMTLWNLGRATMDDALAADGQEGSIQTYSSTALTTDVR